MNKNIIWGAPGNTLKTILRYLFGGVLAGIVVFILFPGLTSCSAYLRFGYSLIL
jgi:hypothetical protein